jgi:hypothetical protein
VSPVVLDELGACEEFNRGQIMAVFDATPLARVDITPEVVELARSYIGAGILPARKADDALHVAVATVSQMDYLVSWNHRHMTNARKGEQYRGVNLMRGYRHTPVIVTPLEVIYE